MTLTTSFVTWTQRSALADLTAMIREFNDSFPPNIPGRVRGMLHEGDV